MASLIKPNTGPSTEEEDCECYDCQMERQAEIDSQRDAQIKDDLFNN